MVGVSFLLTDPNYVTEQGPMLFFTANAESLNALPSTDPYAEPRILQCPDCSRPVLADNIDHHRGEPAKSLGEKAKADKGNRTMQRAC